MTSSRNWMGLLTLLCLAGFLIQRSNALSCPPCHKQDCTADLTKCAHGVTHDICGCCDVCAKGPDEECGGIWNHKLKCGKGLECEPNPRNSQIPGKCRPVTTVAESTKP